MSGDPKLFRIVPQHKESIAVAEVNFSRLGFRERQDIQEWVAANPDILGDNLLIVSKEFSGFDRTNERLDLLAVDLDGNLVVIELKRDDSGTDVHWQAIKYASYLHSASTEDIVRMLSNYDGISEDDAFDKLRRHLDADDLSGLNDDQRIILVSHRFAPEVTSAALWLNEKTPGGDLITCVQLTPYQDEESLYVLANIIIPPPGTDDYLIGVGSEFGNRPDTSGGVSRGVAQARTFERNRSDEITKFLRQVGALTREGLSGDVVPDKFSRWAGDGGDNRYYHMWYSGQTWSNWGMFYRVRLFRLESRQESDAWRADIGYEFGRHAFSGDDCERLEGMIRDLEIHDGQRLHTGNWGCSLVVDQGGSQLDASFASAISDQLRRFVEVITPKVDELWNEINEESP